ncbi:MAG: DNA alkylation repair protein [Bacilli bacterium]|nr:DNA alkylation repair protein [Bacilli bacterium]MDD4282730.1 DNA alkylation repair protein [Bacilli bacterium]MDD4719005.1 DNA alkylation repair protein [Bacilli bacterium]
MTYDEIVKDLSKIKNLKTKDLDLYNKRLIKEKINVNLLKDYVLENQLVHRTYFQVSLKNLMTIEKQLLFIEENEDLLQDWWHVDQLLQFINKKELEFDYIYELATQYIKSPKPFVRRWGYVIFLGGLQKNKNYTKKILSLMKDDEEYYVQMAEAWVICDLAVYDTKEVFKFLNNSKIKYNILGKAIQKICDSFRISIEDKEYAKSLREKLKKN